MDELKKLHRVWSGNEIEDKELNKVIGNPEVGRWVEIFWQSIDEEESDYTDDGYLFQTPYCDDDPDLMDFFIHVPKPDNSSGIGDAPAEWVHLIQLMQNLLVKKIIIKQTVLCT